MFSGRLIIAHFKHLAFLFTALHDDLPKIFFHWNKVFRQGFKVFKVQESIPPVSNYMNSDLFQ